MDLVFLSACEIGSNVTTGGEGVRGFRQAWISAGVSNLAIALWPLYVFAQQRLSDSFWSNLQRYGDPSVALRMAKLSIIEQLRAGGMEVGVPHPLLWAGMVMVKCRSSRIEASSSGTASVNLVPGSPLTENT